MNITLPKETEVKPYVEPDLLKMVIVEERLDVKPQKVKITWTDQHGTERNIQNLTDGHAANLAPWLRDRGLVNAEQIIQAELERRCTGSYPDNFDSIVEEYKSCPETWRMKVY